MTRYFREVQIFHVNILKFEQKNPNMLRLYNVNMRRDL